MTGTAGQKRLPKEFVEYFNFPLPPLNEQKRIVEKVNQLFSMIERLQKLLVEEGLVEQAVLGDAVSRAAATDKPLFTLLSEEHILDAEMLVHAVAQVSGVPYVNLTNSYIDQDVLNLLPADIAE